MESHRRSRVSATYHSNVWPQQAMRSEWPPRPRPLDLSHDSIDFMSGTMVLSCLQILNVRMKKQILWYQLIVIHHQGHPAWTLPSLGLRIHQHQPHHDHKITPKTSCLNTSQDPKSGSRGEVIRVERFAPPRVCVMSLNPAIKPTVGSHAARRDYAPSLLDEQIKWIYLFRYDEWQPAVRDRARSTSAASLCWPWEVVNCLSACRPNPKSDKW